MAKDGEDWREEFWGEVESINLNKWLEEVGSKESKETKMTPIFLAELFESH